MGTNHTIEMRDPTHLQPLPQIRNFPRWSKDSQEFDGFCEDISLNGIRHPLQITATNKVVDGETRRQAALAVRLTEVPCIVVPDAEVHEIVIRELVRRRNMTKGQLAYLAAPYLEPARLEWEHVRLENLKICKNPNKLPRVHSVRNRQYRSGEELAESMGISRRLLVQAQEVHRIFEGHPELREEFEPGILSFEKPMGLGAALAGLGYLIKGARKGGRPAELQRQLDLFNAVVCTTAVSRWEYWERFGDEERRAHFQEVRRTASALPQEQCSAVADYYSKVAAEFRRAGRESA